MSMSRRQVLRTGALIAGAPALAACGPFAGGSDSSNGKKELRLLNVDWGALYDKAARAIGEAYAKKHAGTKLSWDFVEDWQTKLLTEIAGNTPPDAAYTNWSAHANLAAGGRFIPLDDYLKSSGLSRTDFVKPMYDTSLWQGKLYALPASADSLGLLWSKDLYRSVGLDPEKPPTTADELIAHSKEILKKDSSGNIVRIGYTPGADDFIQWAFIFGGSFFDAEKQQVTANHPANIDALNWMYKYVKLLDVNKLATFSNQPSYSEPGNPLASKRSAYLMTGVWAYQAMDQYAPGLDYGVAYWPTLRGTPDERTNYLLQGWMYGIPKGAKNPDESWRFIKYAFVTLAGKFPRYLMHGPCLLDALPEYAKEERQHLGTKNRMTPYLHIFDDELRAGTKYWPVMRENSYYYDQVSTIYDYVMRGKMTAKEGLTQVTDNVQKRLDGK